MTNRQKLILKLTAELNSNLVISIMLDCSIELINSEQRKIKKALGVRTKDELLLKLSDPTGDNLRQSIEKITGVLLEPANDPYFNTNRIPRNKIDRRRVA